MRSGRDGMEGRARGGPAIRGRVVSVVPSWPPAAHAMGSGASDNRRMRPRSCAVPAHGGAFRDLLHELRNTVLRPGEFQKMLRIVWRGARDSLGLVHP